MPNFLGVPVDAAYHLVSGLTGILTPVLGGLAAVAAIVAFTMAVRLLLMPLSLRALRGQAVQARLAPQLVALRQRYGKQPERLQREMSALYKREGTSVFAVPSIVGDRNSRYMTDRNGHCSSSGAKPANRLVPSRW